MPRERHAGSAKRLSRRAGWIPETRVIVRRCHDAAKFLAGRPELSVGRPASQLSVAADLSSQLADFELVHLELERAQRDPERPGGRGDVPGRLLEGADDEVALEGRYGPIQQVFGGRARVVSSCATCSS